MTKRKFKTFSHGIDFFMLMNQWRRVSDEIKKLHDMVAENEAVAKHKLSGIKYYKVEQSILLGKIHQLVTHGSIEVEDEGNDS